MSDTSAPENSRPRMGRGKRIAIGGGIALLTIFVVAAGTIYFFKPVLKLGSFGIVQRKDSSFTFTLNIAVFNPLPVAFRVDAYSFQVEVDGKTVAHNQVYAPIDLPAFKDTLVPVSVDGYEYELPEFLQMGRHQAPLRREYDIKLTGWVDIGAPLRHRHSFHYEWKVPAFTMPDIMIHALRIERMDLFNPAMVLELEITNPNSFYIEQRDFIADIAVNRIPFGKVESRERVKYEARKTTLAPFHFQIESIRGAAGALSIFAKGEVQVRVQGSVQVIGEGLGDFPFVFDKEGPAPVYLQQLAPGLSPR